LTHTFLVLVTVGLGHGVYGKLYTLIRGQRAEKFENHFTISKDRRPTVVLPRATTCRCFCKSSSFTFDSWREVAPKCSFSCAATFANEKTSFFNAFCSCKTNEKAICELFRSWRKVQQYFWHIELRNSTANSIKAVIVTMHKRETTGTKRSYFRHIWVNRCFNSQLLRRVSQHHSTLNFFGCVFLPISSDPKPREPLLKFSTVCITT